MKTKLLTAALVASAAFTLAPAANASLLVGWHDFDGSANTEPADYVAGGFSGNAIDPSSVTSENTGGSNDNFYGSSTYQVLPGTPTQSATQDGHAKVQASKNLVFNLTNNSAQSIELGALFFDAAYRDVSGTLLSVAYQIGAGTPVPLLTTAAGDLIHAQTWTSAYNYTDFALNLVGVTLGNTETISFIFSITAGSGATSQETVRIDNVAITAIPEPAGLLALACVLGSGLMLRSRPRSAAAAATA